MSFESFSSLIKLKLKLKLERENRVFYTQIQEHVNYALRSLADEWERDRRILSG